MACDIDTMPENFNDTLVPSYPFSTSPTISDEDASKMRTYTIVNCVINACSSFPAALGNGIILLVIWKSPSLHSPSNTLLFCLALTDFFVGFLTQPLQVAINLIYLVSEKSGPPALMAAFDVLSVILSTASFTTATVISIDRYLVFYLHMRYKAIVTSRKIIAIIAVGWLLSGLLGFIWTQSTQSYYYAAMTSFGISFSIIVLMYFQIFRIVRRHQAQIQMQVEVGTQKKTSSQLHFARCTKSAVNTFYVCFLLFVCYFPYTCTAGVIQLTGYSTNKYIALQFAGTVIFINSALNPLVYFWRVVEIRKAIKCTFKCDYSRDVRRRQSEEMTSRM